MSREGESRKPGERPRRRERKPKEGLESPGKSPLQTPYFRLPLSTNVFKSPSYKNLLSHPQETKITE